MISIKRIRPHRRVVRDLCVVVVVVVVVVLVARVRDKAERIIWDDTARPRASRPSAFLKTLNISRAHKEHTARFFNVREVLSAT